MKVKVLVLLNFLSVIVVLLVNYYSQAFGINGNRVGQLSARYENVFTPASYAFSIWGLIFFLLLIYGLHQVRVAFSKSRSNLGVLRTGYWFLLANIMNAAWVIVWLYELTWLSIVVMLTLLSSLLVVIIRNELGRTELALEKKFFVQWPITIYAGWIAVATIANFSAFFAKVGWDGGFLTEIQWTLVMMTVGTLVYLYMAIFRNLRSFAMVGVWAIYAIHVRHQFALEWVSTFALVCAAVIMTTVVVLEVRERFQLALNKG